MTRTIAAVLLATWWVWPAHAQELLSIEIIGPADAAMEYGPPRAGSLPSELSLRATVRDGKAGSSPAANVLEFELLKLRPSRAEPGDRFGAAVALSSGLAAAGAPGVFNQAGGSVYLFDIQTKNELSLLSPDGPTRNFGSGVTVNSTLVVASDTRFIDGTDWLGAAHVFDHSTGVEVAEWIADWPTPPGLDGWFHQSRDSTDDHIVIGSLYSDDYMEYSAPLTVFDASALEKIATIDPPGNDDGSAFGYSVSVRGQQALVGAPTEWNGMKTGGAFLIDFLTTEVVWHAYPDDALEWSGYGFSVALDESVAIVGAQLDDDVANVAGAAYLIDSSNGEHLAKLVANDGAAYDAFGAAVGVSGDIAIVGAPNNDEGGPDAGAVYLFEVSTGLQLAKIVPDDAVAGGRFGTSVAICGSTAIIGAPNKYDNGGVPGAAYVLSIIKTCPADVNGDGELNVLDFVAFQLAWQGQEPAGDCDANGAFNALDFVCYQGLFAQGCP